MNQEVITRILDIEREAVKIRDDAKREAARLLKESEDAATAEKEQALEKARQEADQIVADGQAAAGQARAEVIAQAQKEAQQLEATMAQHLDRAVQFVLDQVTGQA